MKIRDFLVKNKIENTPPPQPTQVLVISLTETLFWYCFYSWLAWICEKKNKLRSLKPTTIKKTPHNKPTKQNLVMKNLKLAFINWNGIFLAWLVCVVGFKVQCRANKVFSDSALSTSVEFHFWDVMAWVSLCEKRCYLICILLNYLLHPEVWGMILCVFLFGD